VRRPDSLDSGGLLAAHCQLRPEEAGQVDRQLTYRKPLGPLKALGLPEQEAEGAEAVIESAEESIAKGEEDRRIEWEGLDVIPFEGGLVKRKDVYSDSVSILRQVGLLD
jgi:hypothetical protein